MSDYKLVPVEPTSDMLCSGIDAYGIEDCLDADVHAIYTSMIAAAPAVHGVPVGWQLDSPGGRVFLEKEYPEWAEGGDGYRIAPLYAAPQMPAAVQPGDECSRCKGKGKHVTGPIDCPAVTICKLCSVPSAQPGPLTCMTGKVCGGDATLNTVNVELDAAPVGGDLPIGARVYLRAGGEEVAEQHTEMEECLSSKKDFYDDTVEDIAFALAFECEEAELDPNDKVIINREKLKAIAARVMEKAERRIMEQQPAPDVARNQTRESAMVILERDNDGTPTVWCDPEIADLVSALNKASIRTIASCSGHDQRPGNIVLADGRELMIARDFDEARKIDSFFPGINGEPPVADVAALIEALEAAEKTLFDISIGAGSTNFMMGIPDIRAFASRGAADAESVLASRRRQGGDV